MPQWSITLLLLGIIACSQSKNNLYSSVPALRYFKIQTVKPAVNKFGATGEYSARGGCALV
jgi:hypothetical protein